MSARANDLGLVGDAFTMSAAVFGVVGGHATTGGIGTFLSVSHSPPLRRLSSGGGVLFDAEPAVKGSPLFEAC
jgi:hypothetical protein